MAHFYFNLTSSDNKRILRSQSHQHSIEVLDKQTQQRLYQREDRGGYHFYATFTDDDNQIIYLTFDKHWYIPPVINIWNLKEGSVKEIISAHSTQTVSMKVAYHAGRLLVGESDGSISAYNIDTCERLFHNEGGDEDISVSEILDFAITKNGEQVAALKKKILTIYDIKTGNKRLSTPLLESYLNCQFSADEQSINITHPDKATLSIDLPLIS